MTDGIESAVNQAKAAATGKHVGVHGADTIQQRLNAGLLDDPTSISRRFFLAPESDPDHLAGMPAVPWQPDGDPERQRDAPALPSTQAWD